ncbi:MAG TPA: response regulator [Kiritimatiellia bacterium]|nr:response regulator [Kiritimatiellia bacterium]HPS07835.1 response regulator [Kiritimatiellia bacterium]
MNVTTDTTLAAEIFVVDDTPAVLTMLTSLFERGGHTVRPFPDAREALRSARGHPPDLVLLDINMPDMNGYEFCAELKADPRLAEIPVLFMSGNAEIMDKVKAFALGGVDYVTKPFELKEIEARVATHLKIRRLQLEVKALNSSLQERVRAQVQEISESQIATIMALAKLAESRDEATGNHLLRVQRYCQALARQLAEEGVFGDGIDDAFVENIFHASALHDIGKVGIRDSILLKPGPLTPQEFEAMKTHTSLGAETLEAVLKAYPNNAFLHMGRDIARSHHERWDGSGYPDGLAGEAIPLCARILAVADQYDALRHPRPYKPAFDAARTYAILTEGDGRSSPDHFDPQVLAAFKRIAPAFDAIFQALCD